MVLSVAICSHTMDFNLSHLFNLILSLFISFRYHLHFLPSRRVGISPYLFHYFIEKAVCKHFLNQRCAS